MSVCTIEVWTNLQAAGGVASAALTIVSGTLTEADDNANSLEVVIPADELSRVSIGQVLRCAEPSGRITEWDVRRLVSSPLSATVTVTADPWWMRLSRLPSVAWDAALTPTKWIDDKLLPALSAQGLTWIVRGTVQPTQVVPITDTSTPLALLTALVDGLRTPTTYQFERTSGTAYTLHLWTTRPSMTHRPAVGEDLLSLTDERDGLTLATEIEPVGNDGVGMAYAYWNITGSGTTRTLDDPVTGASPFTEDGQAIGWRLVLSDNTVTPAITASTAAGVVTFASAPTIPAGSRGRFVTDAAGTQPVLSITAPTALTTYGRRYTRSVSRAIGGARQLVLDPGMTSTAVPPIGIQFILQSSWQSSGTEDVVRIPRSEFGVTRTGAANGARGAGTGTGTPFTTDGWLPNQPFYRGDPLTVASQTLYVAANTTADGSGVASLTLTTVNGGAIADNDVITLTRPAMIPSDSPAQYGMRLMYAAGSSAFIASSPHALCGGPDNDPPFPGTATITAWADFTLSNGTFTAGADAPIVAARYHLGAGTGTLYTESAQLATTTVAGGTVQRVRVSVSPSAIQAANWWQLAVQGGSSTALDKWCVLIESSAAFHTAAVPAVATDGPNALWLWGLKTLTAVSQPARKVALVRRVPNVVWQNDPLVGDRLEVDGTTVAATIRARTVPLLDTTTATYRVETDLERLTQRLARGG